MRVPPKQQSQDCVLQLHNIPSKMLSRKEDAWETMRKMGYFRDFKTIELGDLSWVIDYWKDQPAYVIGTSPALRNMMDEGFDFSMLDNYNTIGCNHLIERWDKMKFFLFLDQHFLDSTSYNIKNYQGKLFCRNNVNLFSGDLPYPFYRFIAKRPHESVDNDITKGLFCDMLSGTCCLHLAILSGANPIYLLGMDSGGSTKIHYEDNYKGEFKINSHYINPVKKNNLFSHFEKYADRIINVDQKGNLKYFKKIHWKDMNILSNTTTVTNIKQNVTICHITRFSSPDQWNEVSRQIFSMTEGKHIYANITAVQKPKADIYLLDCIINGAKDFINFQKPSGSKVISIVHSSGKCFPAVCSDRVIVLSNAEQRRMKALNVNSIVIPCAIDLSYYNNEIDYTKKTYGRITRYSNCKVHPRYNEVVNYIKKIYPDSKSYMITKTGLKNPNIEYVETIESKDNVGKAKELSKMSMFVDYHGTFLETFSISLLEGMAAGCCVVLYSIVPQASMIEVIGNSGIICNDEKTFIDTIIQLLPDTDRKKEYGQKAKIRARDFSIEKLVKAYNELFQEVLK